MTYNFKHYLNFVGLPEIGRIEIFEPSGFDGSSHSVKQEDRRFGRDIVLGNEEIELTITRDHFEIMITPQMLPDGVEFKHASQGYDYVLSELKNKGWEAEIEYILSLDGTDFVTGIIDGYTALVSEDEIKFKIIQNTKREEIKRREDIYVNAFSDKDLDENPITPCQTTNILLNAKPVFQVSNWEHTQDTAFNSRSTFDETILGVFFDVDLALGCNTINAVTEYGLEDTLANLSPVAGISPEGFNKDSFVYIQSKYLLKDVTIKISDFAAYCNQHIVNGAITQVSNGSGYCRLVVRYGYDAISPSSLTTIEVQRFDFGFVPSTLNQYFNTDFTVTIPRLEIGQRVWVYLETYSEADFINYSSGDKFFTSYQVDGFMSGGKMEISGTSFAIDSVIKGVRLIDLMKHNVKSVGGVPTIAPVYDIGGEHYDNFAFNGYLLGGVTDKPFNNRFKDITDIPQEICADHQINPDNVEFLTYHDFYTDNEMAVFTEFPDEANESSYNKNYFIKEFWLGYNKSSEGRQNNGKNTIDDVHTDSQWMPQSKKTDGNLKININHSRSAYLIEEQRKRVTTVDKSTALQYDESLFLLDCVAIAPGTRKRFTAPLNYQTNITGGLKILSDGSFNWTLLGFQVGDVISLIESPTVTRLMTVVSITDLMVELQGTLIEPAFSSNKVFTIDYPITGVQYQNRRNETFTKIEGVIRPENYSNLNYSLKRNINRWLPYLATATKFIKGKKIKNTLFKVNGELVTRKTGELSDIIDKADILVDDINDLKILNPVIDKVTVFADFNQATQLFKDVQNIKGFVRVQLNTNEVVKGYPKELDYEWSTGKLTMKLEQKYEDDFVQITATTVNGIIYSGMWFEVNNNFVSLYDSDNILICTPTDFRFVKINGVAYTDITEFSDALLTL